MGRMRRYMTAPARHHRSRGFGIHSPHAYDFVKFVLREKSPYYAYEALREARRAAGKPRETLGELKLVFRVANRFTPGRVLLIGGSELVATALQSVSSRMELMVSGDDVAGAIDSYRGETEKPFVVIGGLDEDTPLEPLLERLAAMLAGEAVLVTLHRDRCKRLQQLWENLLQLLEHGQSFAGHRTGIVVASPRLNREHFELWL